MPNLSTAALLVAWAASGSLAQQATPLAPTEQGEVHAPRVQVYTPGPGVVAPELLHASQLEISGEMCKKKDIREDTVVLSLIVDPRGGPRNISFVRPLGNDLDRIALSLANSDMFSPGTYNDEPAAVWRSLEVTLRSCVERRKGAQGEQSVDFRLLSQPLQKLADMPEPAKEAVYALGTYSTKGFLGRLRPYVGASPGTGISPPVALNSPKADFSNEARQARIGGHCLVAFVVDAQGMPLAAHVLRPLGHGLDEKAIEAVGRYRFKPAMRDGIEPVPVRISAEISFNLAN